MANLTLHFSNEARAELNEILAYIAADNPAAASKLSLKAEKSLQRLIQFPASGRKIPEEPSHSVRELVVLPFLRFFFRVEGDVIRILHVARSERSFPPPGW